MRRKIRSILDASKPRGRVDSRPKAESPPTDNQGQELLWADGGAARRNSTVSSEGHLETGHRRSDQRHPDSFKNFYF